MSMAPKVGYAVTALRYSCESMSTTVLCASAIHTRSVAITNARTCGAAAARHTKAQRRIHLSCGIHSKGSIQSRGGGPSLKSITKRRADHAREECQLNVHARSPGGRR
eukprot:6032627-Pleurochrysis_carterae.AAC.1